MKTVYKIAGMSCEGCADSIKKAINTHIPNIIVAASFEDGTLTISGNAPQDTVEQVVKEAGYQVDGVA